MLAPTIALVSYFAASFRTAAAPTAGMSRTGRTMERCRLQILYSGRVQGVGFRYTVKSLAAGFEVTGTVRNLSDGRVEFIGEGARDELMAFQRAVQDSEVGRFVQNEQVTWNQPVGGFRGFEIIR